MPKIWFRGPLDKALKKLIRPATATTRRKENVIKMNMPRDIFEDMMSNLSEGDAEDLRYDPVTLKLVPTTTTATLRRFEYTIKKGSVSDRLFNLDSLDAPPPPPKRRKTKEVVQIGEEDVYEVEAIVDKKLVGKRSLYQVSWTGYPADHLTWEPPSHINPALVAAFEGKPLPPARPEP